MEEILKEIRQEIAGVPGLQHVCEDWGQLNSEQAAEHFPCALIDVEEIFFLTSKGLPRKEILLNIRVGVNKWNGRPAEFPLAEEADDFAVFGLMEKIDEKMYAWGGKKAFALSGKSVKKAVRNDSMKEYLMVYRFRQ